MTTISDLPTGVTPETDRRAELIAGLRALVDIFEAIPEIPIHGSFGWAVGGRDDTGIPAVEAAAEAVAALGIPHEYNVRDNGRTLSLHVGAVTFDVSHLHDLAYAAYKARKSYERVVQVDAEQDGQVAS